MASRCAQAITRRLASHGGWMGRDELAEGIGFGAGVVDDELADLVVAGTVLFNPRGREYRLGGTLWARRAMRDLVRKNVQRAAVMGQTKPGQRQYSVGLAQVVAAADGSADAQLVMAELEIPYEGLTGMERAAHWVMRWTLGNDTEPRA